MIPVIRLGSGDQNAQDFQLSQESGQFIETLRSGWGQSEMFEDQFPEYYSKKTMTLAYTTNYYAQRMVSDKMVLSCTCHSGCSAEYRTGGYIQLCADDIDSGIGTLWDGQYSGRHCNLVLVEQYYFPSQSDEGDCRCDYAGGFQ